MPKISALDKTVLIFFHFVLSKLNTHRILISKCSAELEGLGLFPFCGSARRTRERERMAFLCLIVSCSELLRSLGGIQR